MCIRDRAIVRDGEGATKFITVQIEGGKSVAECKQIAYAVARSPLVKTAFFASDPNLGRILAAIGYADVQDLDVHRLKLYLDDVLVAEHGGRAASYIEEDGQRIMQLVHARHCAGAYPMARDGSRIPRRRGAGKPPVRAPNTMRHVVPASE